MKNWICTVCLGLWLVPVAIADSWQAEIAFPSLSQEQFQNVQLTAQWKQLPTHFELLSPVLLGAEFDIKGPKLSFQTSEYMATWDLTILSTQTGTVTLPAFRLAFEQDGQQHSRYTRPLTYQIQPNPAFSKPLSFTTPQEPGFDGTYLWITGLGWLALSWAAVFWLKRPKPLALQPLKSPKELALERIQSLRPLCQQQEQKPLHLGLSTALKEFIQTQYQLPAEGQTTEEFLASNRDSKTLPPKALTALESYFRLSDQVKFAGYDPGVSLSEQALNQMQTFVESEGDPV